MIYHRKIVFALLGWLLVAIGCKHAAKPREKDIVPAVKLSESTTEDIERSLKYVKSKQGKLNDSVTLAYPELTDSVYALANYHSLWCNADKLSPAGVSLYHYIEQCKTVGLFPADYYFRSLSFIQRVFIADSNAKKNAAIWARQDILMTDAFFLLTKHLKRGRLPYDSTTLRKDSIISNDFYVATLNNALQGGSVSGTLGLLEPRSRGYDSLKNYIAGFLSKAVFTPYTRLTYPYSDSIAFFKQLRQRLIETGELNDSTPVLDSNGFKAVVTKYQKKYNFRPTGHVSDPLIDKLNNTDLEKFKKIAVNLDRYKLLPDSLPPIYAWVNLPSFTLDVYNSDSLVFQSKVIVGGQKTRSPVLTSEISNFITMPQWTVPYSIIFKEMLPKIRANVDFLDKENLMVVDNNDSVLDPHTINWEKLGRNHFPYLLKQKQGDDNSLGVIKFNFRNKYSVYLHDTNARGLFAKSSRALSHGCVRVKEWEKLADYLIRADSLKHPPDTIRAWISRQEKHVVSGFPKLPLFIRYFTCAGKDGEIRFYDDIYEDDRNLIQKYFTDKTVE